MDYYLWADVKRLVYTDDIDNVNSLKEKIISVFQSINVFVLRKLKRNLRRRAQTCIAQNGAQFEQYLSNT